MICPKCKSTHIWKISNSVYECKSCKKQSSVIFETIFEYTHLPLTKWFKIIDDKASSCHNLRKVLEDNNIRNGRTVKRITPLLHRVFYNVRKYDLFYSQVDYSNLDDLYYNAIKLGTEKYLFYKAILFAIEDKNIDSGKIAACEQALEELKKRYNFVAGIYARKDLRMNKSAFIKKEKKNILDAVKSLEIQVADANSSWLLTYYMGHLKEKVENLRYWIEKLYKYITSD